MRWFSGASRRGTHARQAGNTAMTNDRSPMTTSVDLPQDLLIRRDDARYEEARADAIWNARKPDRYPDAILLARTEQDVVAGVRWAKEQGLKISVGAGGHSGVGNGTRDDGLLVDMSGMQDITVDAAARRVRVHPAVRG